MKRLFLILSVLSLSVIALGQAQPNPTGLQYQTPAGAVDCTRFAGSSPAAQIIACAAAAPNGGVLDARGFPCFNSSNAQLWDQGVVLGFTGAAGTNGKGHILL